MRSLPLVLSLALAGGSAQAAIVTTGTISGNTGDSVNVTLPMFTDPGQYRADIAFSEPGSFMLAYHVERITSLFCDFHDGQGFVSCGGDSVPVGFDLFAGPGARFATLFYAISAPFRQDFGPDEFGLNFDQALGAEFEFTFEQDGSVSYRAVTSPVPEPAAWALMLTGFAIAGLGLRKRKAAFA